MLDPLTEETIKKIQRPAVLITDATNIDAGHMKRSQRTKLLEASITDTIHQGGNVLIPVDTAGRVLEMLHVLEKLWAARRYPYQIYFLSSEAQTTVKHVRDLPQYLNSRLAGDKHAFDFKHVKLIQTLEPLSKAHTAPYVVLATLESLRHGFSLELLGGWGRNALNSILFISRGPEGSLARLIRMDPGLQQLTIKVEFVSNHTFITIQLTIVLAEKKSTLGR